MPTPNQIAELQHAEEAMMDLINNVDAPFGRAPEVSRRLSEARIAAGGKLDPRTWEFSPLTAAELRDERESIESAKRTRRKYARRW